MSERTRFIGLDVHKATIAVAVAEAFGDPVDHGTIPNDPSAMRRLMQRLVGPDTLLRVAYEAGPTDAGGHAPLACPKRGAHTGPDARCGPPGPSRGA